MKPSPLRDYPSFVAAVAEFVARRGLDYLPGPGTLRRLGAEKLAHIWREWHKGAGHDLRADVEAQLGRPLRQPAAAVPRSRYADYTFYLGELRAFVRAKGLTHMPSRKALGHSALSDFLARHRAAHDLAADLGLPYRLDAEDIPAGYLVQEANVRDLLQQFLTLHGLAAVPHEQQLHRYKHYKKLAKLAGPLRATAGLTWAGLVERLGLSLDPQPPRKRPEDYTAAEVIAEVRALCERLGHYPTSEEFRLHGYDYLLGRVRTHFGKPSALAAYLGYPAARQPLVAQDGHLCASVAELRVDDALFRLGVPHRPQRRLVPGKRYSADFALRGPGGMIALEVTMFDPDHPRPELPLCVEYLARFARKAAAYRRHGITLLAVFPPRFPSDRELEEHLRDKLTGHGVSLGDPELLACAPAPADAEHAGEQKPPGYWTNPANVLGEVRVVLEAHQLREVPHMGFFNQIGRHDLKAAIQQYWSREALGAALGLPVAPARRVKDHFWKDLANVEAALKAHVGGRLSPSDTFPSVAELQKAKNHPLANALTKLSSGQLEDLAARLGLVRRVVKRKPPGYWQVRSNVVGELRASAAEHGLTVFPSFPMLKKINRADLAATLMSWRPEELDNLAHELGLERKVRRSPRRSQTPEHE